MNARFSNLIVSEVVRSAEVSTPSGKVFRVEIRTDRTKADSFTARCFEQKLIHPQIVDADVNWEDGLTIWVEGTFPWVDKKTAQEAQEDALDFIDTQLT